MHTSNKKGRKPVPSPHISLGDLRRAVGLTLDQLLDRIEANDYPRPTRGAISALENGHRGGSAALLEAIASAYGLPAEAITTTYVPRAHREDAAA